MTNINIGDLIASGPSSSFPAYVRNVYSVTPPPSGEWCRQFEILMAQQGYDLARSCRIVVDRIEIDVLPGTEAEVLARLRGVAAQVGPDR
jgi:hypothetical protein